MTARMILVYLTLSVLGMTFSCGTADSSLSGAETAVFEKDCDRMFRVSQDQAGFVELSHVNCVFYGNGSVDKPTYEPIARDKIYFIASKEASDIRECQIIQAGEIIRAQCDGFAQAIDLGYVMDTGFIAINPRIALNIYLRGQNEMVYYDSEVYTPESAAQNGVITIAAKE